MGIFGNDDDQNTGAPAEGENTQADPAAPAEQPAAPDAAPASAPDADGNENNGDETPAA